MSESGYIKVMQTSYLMSIVRDCPIISLLIVFYINVTIQSCRTIVDQEVKDTRPNILLIVADDLGFTDLGAFGGEISTPNIDELASQGILFTNYHTSPVCAPYQSHVIEWK